MKKLFFCIFLLVGTLEASLGISHTEGKGLGYSQGYTSLDLFYASPLCENIVPFADLRGHVFNNGKYASNAGLGLRIFDEKFDLVWGISGFYDSFLHSRRPYHQVGIGLEALGETWDFRMNGYFPVGRRKTNIYTLSYDFTSGFVAKANEQLAMGGFDVEVGYHFCTMNSFDLYAGLGPYYYTGWTRKTENAFSAKRKEIMGGRARAQAFYLNYLELEGTATYDSRFKWGGQVKVAVNIPFDWNSLTLIETCTSWIEERLFEPVLRNEMMVINRIQRVSTNPEILNPEHEP